MSNTKRDRIYLSPPHMSEEKFELEYVMDAFETNWIAPTGPHVSAFEKEFAQYIGLPHAAALSSGTAALHLALKVLGVQRGEKVLCSSSTFIASASPIVHEQAEPVFIDSERASWCMDPALLEQELEEEKRKGEKPRAVIVADICGSVADYDSIGEICRRYEVPLIEDAAEALGAKYNGQYAGNFGEIAIFSFNGNKIITTSGGGMILANNKDYVDRSRFLSTQARDDFPHYEHSVVGYNYRMSNVLAAIGRGQLKVLNQRVAKRRSLYEGYRQRLADVEGIGFMPEPENVENSRWLIVMMIDPAKFRASREEIRLALEERNIESRPFWKPMHLQPVFKDAKAVGGEVAEDFFNNSLCLPSGSELTDSQMDEICEVIRGLQ